MEAVQQLLSETADKVAADPVIKEKGVEKLSKKHVDSGCFPDLNDVTAVNECSDAGCYTESEWADSEESASACSLESDASSNAISGNSLVSDADSLAPSCEDKVVKKCPSGGSIVTYDEAVSKLNDGGECKAAGDSQKRAKRLQDAQFDEEDTSSNTAPRMAESAGKAWTDDKHCSYLNSIEATFVRSLYEQDYRAVDMSEQDQDCVESRPMDPGYLTYHAGGELFTSLQRGCYDQREYYRPHYIFAPSAPAVFASPWIQHFNPRMAPQCMVTGGVQDVFAGHTSSTSGFADGIHSSNYMYRGVMEEVMESVSVMPDAPQAPQGWNSRYQSQLNTSTSAPVRHDACTQGKKRPCNLDPCTDGVYRSKKLKSTQQKLAETDLELEEQFVLEQLNQREDGNRLDIRESGRWLNGSSNLHRTINQEEHDRNGAQILQDTPSTQSPDKGKRSDGEGLPEKKENSDFRESVEDRERDSSHAELDCHVPLEQSVDPARGKESSEKLNVLHVSALNPVDTEVVQDSSARKGAVERRGQLRESAKEMGEDMAEPSAKQSAAHRLKLAVDESSVKCQPDPVYDEQDDWNLVPKISPRGCRTYTWGLMGTRRPLLPGNAKETREDETTA